MLTTLPLLQLASLSLFGNFDLPLRAVRSEDPYLLHDAVELVVAVHDAVELVVAAHDEVEL